MYFTASPFPKKHKRLNMISRRLVFLLCAGLLGSCGESSEILPINPSAAPENEWRSYLGDSASSHYSALTQINTLNVADLEIAWRYTSESISADEGTQLQTNPLIIEGILYGVSPNLQVFALNAATGKELWRFNTPRQHSFLPNPSRGLAYWTDAKTDRRRLLFTADSFLYSIDTASGELDRKFGKRGKVDLRDGYPGLDPDSISVNATSPGAVYDNVLILGSRVSEFTGASPGDIRAYDVVTGVLLWRFNTIPAAGEYGADTWPEHARSTSGGANSWPGISVDHERGIAYAPTGSATFDFYGGDRAGDNLFANSLLALDAKTGKRIWHQQLIRHDLWDRDLPAAPNLIALERDGQKIAAVAQVTKTGHIFVFDRETGEPLFPIEETPVGGVPLPGEFPSATQPLPTSPPPFTRQRIGTDTLTDRNPTIATMVRKKFDRLSYHGLYTLPSQQGTLVYPGIDGGAEWGGAAWDEASQTLFVNANEVPYIIQMVAGEATDEAVQTPRAAYLLACSGCHGVDRKGDGISVPSLINLSSRMNPLKAYQIGRDGRGRMPANEMLPWYGLAAVIGYLYLDDDEVEAPEVYGGAGDKFAFLNAGWQKFVDPEGLPASAPPWGTLTAIDLKNEKIKWRLPLGDYPKALAMGHKGFGAENYGGPVVTAGGLLFIAATPDSKFRAYNSASGELLWETALPASGFATPAVYEAEGRQYVVIAAGGGKLGQASSAEYLAFALPLAGTLTERAPDAQ
ncbi:MAG: quinoprotein glucose dehydrogenase [Bacteroidia bacterium]